MPVTEIYLRKGYDSADVYLENSKDYEGVAVWQDVTHLQHHREDDDRDSHLDKGGNEPGTPMDSVV